MDDRGFASRSRAHLESAGESYFEHMGVATRIGGLLVVAGLACLVHAIFPGLCTDRASRTIRRLHDRIEQRRPNGQPANDWMLDFQI